MFMKIAGVVNSDGVHPPKELGGAEDIRHGVLTVSHAFASRHQARVWWMASVGRYAGYCPFKG
jgi:hypothetical protein